MNHPVTSLWATPKDERDFKLGSIMGHAAPTDLPDEYSVGDPIVIKDQGPGTDMCQAYALSAVSEDEEGVALDPFYSFGAIKYITGDKAEWGADLRSTAKSAVIRKEGPYGFLEATDLSKLTNPATQDDRDMAADYDRISKLDMEAATKHAKKSFFSVDGPYDLFDNMRSAMWQTRNEHRSILTGCNWRTAWTYSPQGIIESAPRGQTFGHALKVFGWKKDYMQLQLSNGIAIGDKGIFWIARDALNQAFTFGAFTFLDMPREDAQNACIAAEAPRTFFGIPLPFSNLFANIKP